MTETEKIPSQSMVFRSLFRFPHRSILVFIVILWGILIPQWSVEAAESEKSTEVSDTFKFSDNDGGIYPKSSSTETIIDFESGSTISSYEFHRGFKLTPLISPEMTFKRQVTEAIGDKPVEGGTDFFKKDRKDELYILGVEQKSKSFEYGVAYRFVGQEYNQDANRKNLTYRGQELEADQEGIEVWGGRKIGPMHLKGFISNFYDNVDRNPNLYRMMDFEYGLETSYQLSSVPLYFFGSYSGGSSLSTMEPDGSSKKGTSTETYKGALYFYGGNSFDVTASSSYSPAKEKYQSGETTETYWHEISANIRPVWYISITPTVSFGEYKYQDYGESTENPSASLSVTYSRLFDAVDLSLWGSYSKTKSTDGYENYSEYSGSLGISWEAGYFDLPKMKFNINLGYDAYLDEIYRDSSSDSYATSFSFELPL